MMRNASGPLAVLAAALLAAAPAAAQTEAEMAAFLAAVKAVGCTLDGSTAPVVEQTTGLSPETLGAIMTTLTTQQLVTFSAAGDSVTVLAGPCAE